MDLDLDQLEIQDFKTYVGDPVIINFRDRGPGLHFVRGRREGKGLDNVGSNGVGKTGIWDALSWALTGKAPRRTKALRNPQIVPWKRLGAKGPPTVRAFVRLDGKEHLVERIGKTNGVKWDGKFIDQKELDRKLRLNYTILPYTVLYAQNVPLLFDLEPSKKLELVSDGLSLDRFEEYSDRAKKRADELKEEIDSIERALIHNKAQLEQTVQEVGRLNLASTDWETLRAERLKNADKELKALKAELKDISAKHDDASLTLDETQRKLKEIRKDIKEYNAEVARLKGRHDTEIAVAQRDYELKRDQFDKLSKSKNKKCPLCGEALDAEHLQQLKKDVDTAKRKIPSKSDWTRLKLDYDNFAQVLASFEEDEAKLDTQADDAQGRVTILAPRLGELQAKIADLQTLRNERAEEANPYYDQMQQARRHRGKLDKAIKDDEIVVAKRRRAHKRYSYWIKGFRDLRLYVLEGVLQELELATHHGLAEMGLSDWRVLYEVEKETQKGTITRGLNTTVLSPNNEGPVEWESWSGGTQQLLRLSGSMGFAGMLLHHAGVNPSFEIFDEPCQGLADIGVEHLIQFLADRAHAHSKQIFLTEHFAVESNHFASTLTVTLTKHGTKVE